MAQSTISISLGSAEVAALQHVLATAQAAGKESIGRADATLSRIETKIVEAKAKQSVRSAPKDDDGKTEDADES
jgi:hypothetical protein